jgi:hypothetical protein
VHAPPCWWWTCRTSKRHVDAVVEVFPQRDDVQVAAIHTDDRQRRNDHLLGEIPADAVQHQDLPPGMFMMPPSSPLDACTRRWRQLEPRTLDGRRLWVGILQKPANRQVGLTASIPTTWSATSRPGLIGMNTTGSMNADRSGGAARGVSPPFDFAHQAGCQRPVMFEHGRGHP